MNPDLPVLIRNNYSVLDVMSDVGGLAEVLFRFIYVILALLNYNHLTSYLTAKLFKAEPSSSDSKKEEEPPLKPTKFGNVKEMLFELLPKGCIRCCIDKRSKTMLAGWEGLNKEKDIVSILRSLRYYKKAIRFLIADRDIRKKLKQES